MRIKMLSDQRVSLNGHNPVMLFLKDKTYELNDLTAKSLIRDKHAVESATGVTVDKDEIEPAGTKGLSDNKLDPKKPEEVKK